MIGICRTYYWAKWKGKAIGGRMMKVAVLGLKKSEKVVEDSRENWVIHDGPSKGYGQQQDRR